MTATRAEKRCAVWGGMFLPPTGNTLLPPESHVPHGTLVVWNCGGTLRPFASTALGWRKVSEFPSPTPLELEAFGLQNGLVEIYDQTGNIIWQRA